MAELYTIDGVHITNVRSGGDGEPQVELVESADHGDIGSGSITLDDTAGTQATVGHTTVVATQDSCSVPRTFTGYVGQRQIKRGTDKTESKRFIDVTTLDLNTRFGINFIHGTGSRRPAEGIDDRLTWLLGNAALSSLIGDYGFVDYPTTTIDEADYRGRFPKDVLDDLALEAGFNYFAYWSAADNAAGLWFKDSNTSTDFSSTLRFSSVATDIDSSTTFAAGQAQLTRDPSQVISQVWMPYARGNVIRTRAATETTFPRRGGVAPSSDVKRRTNARRRADRYLFARRNEEDAITDTWTLPDTHINLVRAGQRVQARYAQFDTEGYGEFSWFRILETRKKPLVTDAGVYSCGVTLSPQEGGCSVTPTFVQYNGEEMDAQTGGGQPNWTWRAYINQDHTTASTPGNLIRLVFMGDGLNAGTLVSVPAGWSSVFTNLNTKADDSGIWCHSIYKKSEGESYVDVQMTGSARGPVYQFMEYAGLTNPVLSGSYSINRQVGLGYATAAATTWPAGAALVLADCFMHVGPESGDALAVNGTGLTLRTPQDSGGNPGGFPAFFGSPSLGVADSFKTPAGTGGTSPVFPAAGGWQFTFTNDEETMVTGVVFVGDNC